MCVPDLLEPVVEPVDDDDPLGAHEHRLARGHLPDAAGAPHRDDVTGLHLRLVRPGPAGRRRVGGEQRPLVGDAVGDREGPLVGVGHPDVGGVAARPAAQRVGVPVAAADGLAPQRLGDPRVGVAVVAQRPQLLLAVPALPAAGEGDHHHPVADLVLRDVLADLGHRAHELVAEHVAGAHRGDVAAQQVQVRAAGHRQADLEDDVVVVEDRRLRDVLHPDLVDPAPGHRLHRTPPLGAALVQPPAARRRGSPSACRAVRGRPPAPRPPRSAAWPCAARTAGRPAGRCPLSRPDRSAPRGALVASRAASSVPLPPAAGRIRVSMRSPYSASGAGSEVASISVGSR